MVANCSRFTFIIAELAHCVPGKVNFVREFFTKKSHRPFISKQENS